MHRPGPAYNLPLYALPLIFPYRSYIGTFTNGVWIGNPPEKSEIFRGDHIDLGEGLSQGVPVSDSDQGQRRRAGRC